MTPEEHTNRFGDMPPEEFRTHAHAVADWIADYLEGVGDYPVLARVKPGDIRGALRADPPVEGEDFEQILQDFQDTVVPGVTHWNHPGFLAYFSITASGPGILGEMLAAALNINAMVWRSSPSGTELEEHAVDWLRRLVGLPSEFDGIINDTASSSSLYALAAAREARYPEAGEGGLWKVPPSRIYTSRESHSSIDKAVITLGFGRGGCRRIEVDEDFRMRPDALRAAILEDLEAGVQPLAAVATLGTTSTTSMDPVARVADIADEFGLWLHVDAAYAGPAAMVPELRVDFDGWERADSIVVNPHKWLFTPIDCSVLYCKRPEMLRGAFSLTPDYLKTSEAGEARNLMDYGVALGRRFRALKLWFVLRYFGQAGIVERLREHVRLAREVADWVDAEPGWERMAPVPFSTIVFRYAPEGMGSEDQDALNQAILDRVNESGEIFLSHTVLHGRTCLRIAIGNLRTTRVWLERAWDLLKAAAREVSSQGE
jgi:aromatic-L-amino-acid decarboxylase